MTWVKFWPAGSAIRADRALSPAGNTIMCGPSTYPPFQPPLAGRSPAWARDLFQPRKFRLETNPVSPLAKSASLKPKAAAEVKRLPALNTRAKFGQSTKGEDGCCMIGTEGCQISRWSFLSSSKKAV